MSIPITEQQASDWKFAKQQLAIWKSAELELRNEICDQLFNSRVGWFTVNDQENGLSAKSKLKYNVDAVILKELELEQLLSQEDVNCFKPKVELNESKIKKLPKESNLWKAITVSPATPELKVV